MRAAECPGCQRWRLVVKLRRAIRIRRHDCPGDLTEVRETDTREA